MSESKEKEKERDSVVTKIQGMMRGAVARKYHKDALPHLIRYALYVLQCTVCSLM